MSPRLGSVSSVIPIGEKFANVRSTLIISDVERIQKILMTKFFLDKEQAKDIIENLDIFSLQLRLGQVISYTDRSKRIHPFSKNLPTTTAEGRGTSDLQTQQDTQKREEITLPKSPQDNFRILPESPYMNPSLRIRELDTHRINSVGG